jgi:hypothetical protein
LRCGSVGEDVSQSASTRTDPTKLDIDDRHAEQILTELDVPPAQPIGNRIARFKFNRGLREHVDVLQQGLSVSESQALSEVQQFHNVCRVRAENVIAGTRNGDSIYDDFVGLHRMA